MRKYVPLLLVALAVAMACYGQSTAPALATYPDVTTAQTAAGAAILSYKSVLEGNIATTFQLEQNDAAAIASLQAQMKTLTNQSSAITDLQNRLTADEAKIAALQTKVASAGNTLATP